MKDHHTNDIDRCLICGSETEYFFSKQHDAKYFPDKLPLKVDYDKCTNCGFVLSRTHKNMDLTYWAKLNHEWHTVWDGWNLDLGSHLTNRPPFTEQAIALKILNKSKLINLNNNIDYAAGYGFLSRISNKYFDEKIQNYDAYVNDNDSNVEYLRREDLGKYDLVLNSAMFEHIASRESLDAVNDLVSKNGVLAIHSVICERIPNDPSWFYLLPVHTAFHTNKSMDLLMEQWGYTQSIYSPQAKTWYLFKEASLSNVDLGEIVRKINQELQAKWFYHKIGFVDYWKGY